MNIFEHFNVSFSQVVYGGGSNAVSSSSASLGGGGAEDPAQAQFYFDDDHELGELGETTDVGCDFGDFGGF